jgi:hypothetical protein
LKEDAVSEKEKESEVKSERKREKSEVKRVRKDFDNDELKNNDENLNKYTLQQ